MRRFFARETELLLLSVAVIAVCLAPGCAHSSGDRVVIAHRGASGYLPEHTLAAQAMAHGWDVDYVETDLVMTRDDRLIVLHDVHLDSTTDVGSVFPDRKRADGRYWAIDFDLDEIRQLRVHERVRHGSGKPYYAGRFPPGDIEFRVPTFDEHLQLMRGLNASTGRDVGIYVEIKAPAIHERAGKDIVGALMERLRLHGYTGASRKVVIQCFDPRYLRMLRQRYETTIPLVQLIGENASRSSIAGYDEMVTERGLEEVARYADGIGPRIGRLVEPEGEGYRISGLARRAHEAGLFVHAYTLRADDLPTWSASMEGALEVLFDEVGIDGVFTDFGDRVVGWLEAKPGR
jgi:glycerophosphoryl diester phosphodiesterase